MLLNQFRLIEERHIKVAEVHLILMVKAKDVLQGGLAFECMIEKIMQLFLADYNNIFF